jgi:hypothetical protein
MISNRDFFISFPSPQCGFPTSGACKVLHESRLARCRISVNPKKTRSRVQELRKLLGFRDALCFGSEKPSIGLIFRVRDLLYAVVHFIELQALYDLP